MVKEPVTIDDKLRLVLARLEGALGVFFRNSEIDRVFEDSVEDQRSEKHYKFFESPSVLVAGDVDEYEHETIWIAVKASKKLMAKCRVILDDAGEQEGRYRK